MFRSTLVLAVILAALAAFYYFSREAPLRQRDSLSLAVLDGYTLDRADRMELRRGRDVPPIVLEKGSAGSWWLIEPIRDLASVARLRSLFQAFDSAMMEPAFPERPGPPDDEVLRMTGLDQPQATLRVEFPATGDGPPRQIEVAIGAAGPLNTDIYLLRDGVIHRGGKALATALQVNVSDLRERLMVRNSVESARVVEIRQRVPAGADGTPDEAGETVRLERDNRGHWQLVAPIEVRTDPLEARQFLAQLLSLRAEEFMPGAMNQPPGVPDLELVVRGPMLDTGPLEDRVQIWVNQRDRLAYGRADGRTEGFTVHNQLFDTVILDAVQRLRARFLVPFSVEDLELLTVDPGGDAPLLRLRRHPVEGFRMIEPYSMATRPGPVAELSQALRYLQAESFVDGDPEDPLFGLVGGLQVVFVGARGGDPVTLVLGADDGDFTYCRRQDEDQVVQIRRRIADLLRRPWIEYASLQVCAQPNPPGRLTLQWDEDGGRVERSWVRGDGVWRDPMQRPVRGPGDEDLLRFQAFIDEFRDLEGIEVIDREAQPDGRGVTVILARGNGDVLLELELVVPDPEAAVGPVYAARDSYPRLRFVLDKGFRDTLRWLLQSG